MRFNKCKRSNFQPKVNEEEEEWQEPGKKEEYDDMIRSKEQKFRSKKNKINEGKTFNLELRFKIDGNKRI